MRHGEIIDIVHHPHLGDQLIVPSRSIERLGIHGRCRCWGAFAHGENAAPFNQRLPEGSDFPFRFPQLIVSMVHPALWTSAFVLTIELDDDPGTLASATKVLSDLGINLISVDASPTAFHQVTLVALASHRGVTEAVRSSPEITEAQRRVAGLMQDVARLRPTAQGLMPRYRAAQRELERCRRAMLNEIGRLMIPALASLRLRILAREHELYDQAARGSRPRGFLRSRVVEYGDRPYFMSARELGTLNPLLRSGPAAWTTEEAEEAFRRCTSRTFGENAIDEGLVDTAASVADMGLEAWWADAVERCAQAHLAPAVHLQAAHHLAHAWVWRIQHDGDGREEAFLPLEYDDTTMGLRMLGVGEANTFASRLSRFYVRPSMTFTNAVVTFDRASAMMRVRFLRAAYMRHCAVHVKINYAPPERGRHDAASTPSMRPQDDLPTESIGMLHDISASARAQGFDLLRVSSRLLVHDPEAEHGQVRMTMVHQSPEDLDIRLKNFQSGVEDRFRSAGYEPTVSLAQFGCPIAVVGPRHASEELQMAIENAVAVCEGARGDLLLGVLRRGEELRVRAPAGFSDNQAHGLVQVIALDSQAGPSDAEIDETLLDAEQEHLRATLGCALGRVFVDPIQETPSEHPREVLKSVEVSGEMTEETGRRISKAIIRVILRVAEEVRAHRRSPGG